MASKRVKISFVCQECGYDSPAYLGKCPECGNWNTFKEFKEIPLSGGGKAKSNSVIAGEESSPQKLSEIVYSTGD